MAQGQFGIIVSNVTRIEISLIMTSENNGANNQVVSSRLIGSMRVWANGYVIDLNGS